MAAANDLAEALGAENLYVFFGLDKESTSKEITKAYRKNALKYHPDKNPGDKKAADVFQKLSQAYDIISDPAAKAAYDNFLKTEVAAKPRNDKLSAKRRKLKEDLESKEAQHSTGAGSEVDAARKLQKEIERLREQGKKRLEEQVQMLRKEAQNLFESQAVKQAPPDTQPTLKVSWKSKKSDPTNGGYDKEVLEQLFSKYGPDCHVLVSAKNNGKAVVSFQDSLHAHRACEQEAGLAHNPLSVSWLQGGPKPQPMASNMGQDSNPAAPLFSIPTSVNSSTFPQSNSTSLTSNSSTLYTSSFSFPNQDMKDYESVTLMKMRQAEERKQLAQQIAEEDDSS